MVWSIYLLLGHLDPEKGWVSGHSYCGDKRRHLELTGHLELVHRQPNSLDAVAGILFCRAEGFDYTKGPKPAV